MFFKKAAVFQKKATNVVCVCLWRQIVAETVTPKSTRPFNVTGKAVVFNLGVTNPEELREDVSCTQLYYICFIRVLVGGRWVMVGCYENHYEPD